MTDAPAPPPVDHDKLYQLLLLEEKLRGHPHLAATKSLVDQALVQADAANKAIVARMQAALKAQEAADQAKHAAEAQAKLDKEHADALSAHKAAFPAPSHVPAPPGPQPTETSK
jgi:hypothetical protein